MTTNFEAFTSYGRGAGSARVRVFDWLDHLALETKVSSYLGRESNSLGALAQHPLRILEVERRLRDSLNSLSESTVMVARGVSPFSNGELESRILMAAERGVYDFDDALMHTPTGASERAWSKRKTWRRSVESADVVIAGNDYLAEAASRLNGNVVTIPSCVEPDHYVLKQGYDVADVPVAVWLGSPSTEQYLLRIATPLLSLHRSRGLRLKVISRGSASLRELDCMVDRVSWTAEGFQKELAAADFGIMPLDETPWTRGKCAYKLVQYGAAGLPMIGSDVGANSAVLSAADGFAVLHDGQWHDAMVALLDETTAVRRARGVRGRQAVEREYSFDAWSSRWMRTVGLL